MSIINTPVVSNFANVLQVTLPFTFTFFSRYLIPFQSSTLFTLIEYNAWPIPIAAEISPFTVVYGKPIINAITDKAVPGVNI